MDLGLGTRLATPRKTVIREKEKRDIEAKVLSATTVKSKDTGRGNAQKKLWCARNRGTGRHRRRRGGRPTMYKKGKVEGQKVTYILLETGCSRTMVRRNLVATETVHHHHHLLLTY